MRLTFATARVPMLDGILHGAMQRDFKAQQLVGIGGSEIDGGLSAFRNRVHADAAANGAEIERGARLFGQGSFGQRGQSHGQRGDGVRRARIGKAMPAGSGDGNLVAAAAQSLGDGCIGAGAIQHNVRGDAAGERAVLVKMAHAAQVAFAFFAHIAQHDQRDGQFNAGVDEGAHDGQHSDHAGGIVAGARRVKTVAVEYVDGVECRRERRYRDAQRAE